MGNSTIEFLENGKMNAFGAGKYRFIDKYMIRLIMWITNGPTDISKTYEFTNWDKVEEFAHEIKKITL